MNYVEFDTMNPGASLIAAPQGGEASNNTALLLISVGMVVVVGGIALYYKNKQDQNDRPYV